MTRSSINKDAVTSFFLRHPFLFHSTTFSIMEHSGESYFVASPDEIHAIDATAVPDATEWLLDKSISVHGKKLCLSSVKIKTRISTSSWNKPLHTTGSTIYAVQWHSKCFRDVQRTDHMGQMLHQCTMIIVNAVLYVCAAETRLHYMAIVYIFGDHL